MADWARKKLITNMTLTARVRGEFDRRGDNRSEICERDALRYYEALAACGDFLTDHFSPNEWAVLIAAIPDVSAEAVLSLQGWKLIEQQCIRRDLHKQFRCEPRALMNKLASLSRLDVLALVDAVERWTHASEVQKPTQINPFKAKELSA